MFLAQAALLGAGVVLVVALVHLLLPAKYERAISKALDFNQREGQ